MTDQSVTEALITAAGWLLVAMIGIPLLRGWQHDNSNFAQELQPLFGAPSAGTVWLLLLLAAQYGDITAPLLSEAQAALAVGAWAMFGLVD